MVYGQPAIAAALGHGLGASVLPSSEGPRLKIPRWGSSGLSVKPQYDGGDAMQRAFSLALGHSGLDETSKVNVTIDGQLPLGVGLGSSAAFAVSLLRGLSSFRNEPFRRSTHGRSSRD